jgi:hypothetical protein
MGVYLRNPLLPHIANITNSATTLTDIATERRNGYRIATALIVLVLLVAERRRKQQD